MPDFNLAPVDGATIMGQTQGLVPNPLASDAERAQIEGQQLQNEQAKQQLIALHQKAVEQQTFQQDLTAALHNGGAGAISQVMMKHPQFADQIKSAWDLKDNAAKQSDLTSLGELYSAGSSGDWTLAAKLAHARHDADAAAGNADPEDAAFVDAVDKAAAGDETQRKVVLGTIGTHLAAVAGPEHFASVYGALNPDEKDKGFTLDAGATRYDSKGNVVAQSPYLKAADGSILERDATPGTPTASTAAGAGGQTAAINHVLANEGGYNPSDMNGAPVNYGINAKANAAELKKLGISNIKDLTKDQAAQIYATKYWPQSGAENLPANMQAPYFDVYIRNPGFAKKALAQSGGDPAQFMALSNAYFGKLAQTPRGAKYANAWQHRDAGNTAIATGATAPAEAATGAPAGYHVLVPGKQKDAPTGYTWSADGKSLAAIPGGPADDAGLDPSTIHFYAQSVAAGQPMPPLGMGKSATKARQQIMKEAARTMGAEGLSGQDFAIQSAHYKAGIANISNLEKQLGTVSGNEATFAQNSQQVADLARKLPLTDSRLLNTGLNTYLRQTNDPTVAAMDVALKTAANEYARLVTASPSGAGTLSDSARMEYQGVIDGNFPLKQKLMALHQMSVDAANRTKSLRSTLQDSYTHLTDRAPELRGGSSSSKGGDKPASEGWVTLPSGLKVRKIR